MKKLFKDIKNCLNWKIVIFFIVILNLFKIFTNTPSNGIFLIDYPIIELNIILIIIVSLLAISSIFDKRDNRKMIKLRKQKEKEYIIEDSENLSVFLNTYKPSSGDWTFNTDEEIIEFLKKFKMDIKFKSQIFKNTFH